MLDRGIECEKADSASRMLSNYIIKREIRPFSLLPSPVCGGTGSARVRRVEEVTLPPYLLRHLGEQVIYTISWQHSRADFGGAEGGCSEGAILSLGNLALPLVCHVAECMREMPSPNLTLGHLWQGIEVA